MVLRYSCVIRVYSNVIRMSLAHNPYVTLMYSYIIRMSLVFTRMPSVFHSYVPVCHPYFTCLLLKNSKDGFEDLSSSSGDISIYQRYINLLLIEVYKYIHGLSPEIMNVVFYTRANTYNTRQFNVFETHIPTWNRYGLNSILYKANQLWNLLLENLKSSPSLTLFKSEIKLWECFNCPCNM